MTSHQLSLPWKAALLPCKEGKELPAVLAELQAYGEDERDVVTLHKCKIVTEICFSVRLMTQKRHRSQCQFNRLPLDSLV